ncbi:MAG: hypothetical protein ABFS34_04560 [Gemmatimonadota bacterium]
MTDVEDLLIGTYRCPVCGHRDVTELEMAQRRAVISCSYCDTPLEVSSRGSDSVRFAVQVAGQPSAR